MQIDRKRYFFGLGYSYYRKIYRKLFRSEAPYYKLNGIKVVGKPASANQIISQMLLSDEPCMIARFGSVEMSVLNNYYAKILGIQQNYKKNVRKALCLNAGFFPDDEQLIDKFADKMLESCEALDVVGLWNDVQEIYTVKTFAPRARGVRLYCLEPYYDLESTWTQTLKGQKVLVVHPFAETIEKQFDKKNHFFSETFWPECEWITFKAVQTIAGERDARFATWFDALEYMECEISKLEFDVAIIGCGAYGFPLAAFIKKMGKKAIHLGGATQLLFGIRAKRWEHTELSRYFNEFWVSPSEKERPVNAELVEKGCYW